MRRQVHDLSAFLQGPWRLHRRICDQRAQVKGRFSGDAVFSATASGLDYQETGQLRLGSYVGFATRQYQYLKTDRAAQLNVHFSDGRFFYQLDLSQGLQDVVHLCGNDRYLGQFKVLSHDLLITRWNVAGPKKQTLITSRYQRVL